MEGEGGGRATSSAWELVVLNHGDGPGVAVGTKVTTMDGELCGRWAGGRLLTKTSIIIVRTSRKDDITEEDVRPHVCVSCDSVAVISTLR